MKAGEVDRIFKKLQMKTRDGKDRLAWFMHEGKPILFTRRSHGRGDVGNIAHFIRQQLRVNEEQFADLRDCPMTREQYVDLLKAKGLIRG
jgi:hypothetical protein